VLSLVIIRYDSEIAGFSGQLGLGVCPQNQSGVANGLRVAVLYFGLQVNIAFVLLILGELGKGLIFELEHNSAIRMWQNNQYATKVN
jgi:hypothetical protein